MGNPGRHPLRWPIYVYEYLSSLGVQEEEDMEAWAQGFVDSWGGLNVEGLRRASREAADERERLFALLALGHQRSGEAPEALIPFLDSVEPLERWASAISLGELGHRGAVPTLCWMLTQFLPGRMKEQPPTDTHFEAWPGAAPHLLARLGDPAAVPPLRHALHHMASLLEEDALTPDELALLDRVGRGLDGLTYDERLHVLGIMDRVGPPTIHRYRVVDPDTAGDIAFERLDGPSIPIAGDAESLWRYWYGWRVRRLSEYQDDIVYALGRLRALGALTELRVAEPFLEVWCVHLLMGSLHDRYGKADVSSPLRLSPALEADLRQRLVSCFGLAEGQQERALALYSWTKIRRVRSIYSTEEYRATRDKSP